MTLPGYTAEVTLYRSTQAYRLSVASGGSTERVHPALNPLAVKSSPWFGVLTLLCCEGCWQRGGRCAPADPNVVWGGCLCVTDVPVLGGGAPSVD
jgi:hypothetical protein